MLIIYSIEIDVKNINLQIKKNIKIRFFHFLHVKHTQKH